MMDCMVRATRMAGKAVQPYRSPIIPFNMRCTLVGPMGTWTRDATKKVDDRMATWGILS